MRKEDDVIPKMNSKGLGMWTMSKVVMLIFVFLLASIMGSFMVVQRDRSAADSSEGFTNVLSEVAGQVHYSLSKDYGRAALLPKSMETVVFEGKRIDQFEQPYTIVVVDNSRNNRVVFLMSWGDYAKAEDITREGTAFSASFVEFEDETELRFFRVDSVKPAATSSGKSGFEISTTPIKGQLLVRPSPLNGEGDRYLLFYKSSFDDSKDAVFCIAVLQEKYSISGDMLLSVLSELGRNECKQ